MKLGDLLAQLKVLVPMAKAVPVLGSTVEGAIEAAIQIAEMAEAAKSNKEDMETLARQVGQWASDLCEGLKSARAESLSKIEGDVNEALKMITKIRDVCQKRVKATAFSRFRTAKSDASTLQELRNELGQAQARFISSSALYVGISIAKMYDQAQHDAVYAALDPVRQGEYDALGSRNGCMPGTREYVMTTIYDWAKIPVSGLSIFWLGGMAGTGKSTIAKTACEVFAGEGRLGASFFVSRQDILRRDPHRVLRTIAYQLALKDPVAFRAVYQCVSSERDISSRPMEEQMQKTLAAPLTSAINSFPREMVIVIDALDECDKLGGVESGGLIPLLASKLSVFDIKLLVTSRNEHKLALMFGSLKPENIQLHSMDKNLLDGDVRRYIETELGRIGRSRGVADPDWPSPASIQTLVENTGPFFIYAATVIKYIEEERHDPVEQLQLIIEHPWTGSEELGAVDALYEYILAQSIKDSSGKDDTRVRKRLQLLLGIVVVAMEPLNVTVIAKMLSADAKIGIVQMDVASLSSVLVSSTNQLVNVLHASLPDFLQRRSANKWFRVDSPGHHMRMSLRCLEILNSGLRENICNLADPSLRHSEVPDLEQKLKDNVSDELQYAAKYWLAHLLAGLRAASDVNIILQCLDEFCSRHLLHWLELSSLQRGLPSVRGGLRPLLEVFKRFEALSDHCARYLLADANKLAFEYSVPITEHALHVYHSARVTMPDCVLARQYSNSDSTPVLISGQGDGWDTSTRTLVGHEHAITSVAISTDGQLIVSGSSDKTVRMWDAATGTERLRIIDHEDMVTSVALSTDDQIIISGSLNKTVVRVYDTATGTERLTLVGHEGGVTSLAFSADGQFIVSGSRDRTVRVWDTATGTEWHKLIGHQEGVTSVAFSADGKFIISGSWDGTVRVWDAAAGIQRHILVGHERPVTSVAFSTDGQSIVSSSRDKTMRVWDAATGTQRRKIVGHEHVVTSVAFSADGQAIISGSNDKTVRVWDAATGTQRRKIDGHEAWVSSVAFSADGQSIVSGSGDKTVRVWDAVTGTQRRPLVGHACAIGCVALSAEGQSIVSGSDDKTVRVWDAATGTERRTLVGHEAGVESVAFSADGQFIVSGSNDSTVCVWDTATGIQRRKLVGHEGSVRSVAFSADGHSIISSSWDKTIRVWDVATGTEQRKIVGHGEAVQSVALSADGQSIVSGSDDKTVRVWDVATGTQRHQIVDPTHSLTTASVSLGIVLAGTASNEIHHYKLNSMGWILCSDAGDSWRRVCWIPPDRSMHGKLCYAQDRVCIGARNGAITIIDFANVQLPPLPASSTPNL